MRAPPAGASAATVQRPDQAHSLVPLVRALEMIADQVYPARRDSRPMARTDLLDGLACTVSALVPLFVADGQTSRQLSEAELDKALFRMGGAEMYFTDGRSPMHRLAVTPDGIAKVIRILKGTALAE